MRKSDQKILNEDQNDQLRLNPMKEKRISVPRNSVGIRDIMEVLRYIFTPTIVVELLKKFGYYIHDHVAPICQMNVQSNPRIHPSASLRCGYNIYLGRAFQL